MEYFVTFTLVRGQTPQLFVSGDRAGGQGAFHKTLLFENLDQLQERWKQAELPHGILEADQGSPVLLTAGQLAKLGVAV